MKFAILSDIHGNLPALETVLDHIQDWHAHIVIVNGDIVNRGPSSAACWARLQTCQQQAGWHILQGNHEAYVYAYAQSTYDPAQFNAMSFWTYQQMNGQTPLLQALPEKFSHLAPNRTELR
ncbi:MAG: metallophosphoesterase, partial [Chloroflexi bacterium]|nr:metallophosphoesterase [Chloroflexota bacterium]